MTGARSAYVTVQRRQSAFARFQLDVDWLWFRLGELRLRLV